MSDVFFAYDGLGGIAFEDEMGEPISITHLTESNAWGLHQIITDGLCPVCGKEIPADHVTCRDCAEAAARAWGLLEEARAQGIRMVRGGIL